MSWKDEAVRVLNDLYQNFEGAQWHEFELKTDTNLLLAKICYAIFGEPINELTDECDLSTAYDSSQKELAGKISEHIRNKVYKDVQSQKFLFKVIFVVCKEGDKPVHMQPLFCLFADGDPETANCGRRYIDMSCRTYKDWTDWKENNTLPIMEYAYPKYGFFSCSAYKEYEFDENRVPNVEFGESPRSSVGSQVARATDITTSIVGLVAGGVMIASMFTPLGPVVMLGSTIAGSSGAAWGFGRSVQRLVDKGTHDEDMTDLESWTHYLSLVAAPLSFGSNIFSARLAQGAILEGRIFSSSMRAFVTTLNFASLGVSGTLVGIGFYNLVEKQRAGNLESLDVVQFSMSIFFFSNTLIKPQFATNIIRNAQSQHFQNVDASMKTDTAKQTFKKYLDDNNGSGNIQERSKVVRNLNRMQDPSATFDKLGHNNYEQILIGGRKGKTFNLVESKSYDKTIDAPKILHEKMPNTVTQFSVEKYAKLEKHIGKHPDNVRINGRDIFKNASQQEKTRACKMLSQNNTDVVNLGFEVAEKMKITNVNDVLDIVEIVNAKCVDLSE
uniref:DUF4781 domain-containing protein n=1 Tax=Rhabditophanes sp. KR3021 TaxID=114890 RepID=A0AC35TSD8_9BILA